jgi:hypothetical protein
MLNEKLLKKIVNKIADEIYGDWLVFGGTSCFFSVKNSKLAEPLPTF